MPTWNAEMDRKLLLAILKVHDFAIDKDKVATELHTEEQPCTPMAIQKRIQAIKTMIKNGTAGDATPKTKATARKRPAAATTDDESPTKKGKTGKGKGAKAKAAPDGGEDGDRVCGDQGEVKQEDGDESEDAF